MTSELDPQQRARVGRRWVIGLWAALGAVVAMQFTMAWIAQGTTRSLVREDYYEEALRWQERAGSRAAVAAGGLDVKIASDGGIEVYGAAAGDAVVEGVLFYRPDDPRADLRSAVAPATSPGIWRPVSVPTLPGYWRVAVDVRLNAERATFVRDWSRP